MARSAPIVLLAFGFATNACQPAQQEFTPKEQLGKLLFFDRNLSTPAGQACSDCHSPDAGFGDLNQQLPVSRGANPDLYGNRNDLTAAYAALIPPLQFDSVEGIWVGGLFWDGRASTLAEQAKGPPLNPLEMANPDVATIVETLKSADYRDLFLEVYGDDVFDDSEAAYDYMADAIAAYETSSELNRFDSKFDRFLAGTESLSEQELRGKALFTDEQKGNCAACHPVDPGPFGPAALLSDYTYDNLGVPKNPESPFYSLPEQFNPNGEDYVDLGLGPVVQDPEMNGFFRVPTLRNVALTPPYMHNGVFKTLYQVVAFYNSRDVAFWPEPEWPENVNRDELGNLGLTPQEMQDIVAFLKTLSDGFDGS